MQSESTDSNDEGLEHVAQQSYDPFDALAAMQEASVSVVSADVAMGDFADGYELPAPNPLPCEMSALPVPCNADFMRMAARCCSVLGLRETRATVRMDLDLRGVFSSVC